MTLVVDLNRCQSYGQCVYAAPRVFRFQGEESLEYDPVPAAEETAAVERAAMACPVGAITIGRAHESVTPPEPVADDSVSRPPVGGEER